MKTPKIFFLIIFLLLLTHTGKSQNYHYYNVGDTIRGRDSIYHYQWWSEDWLSDTSRALTEQMVLMNKYSVDYWNYFDRFCENFGTLHGEILRYCYTDIPINIVGLAVASWVLDSYYQVTDEEPYHQEYLRLYDASESSFILVAEVPFVNASPVRYIDLDVRDQYHSPTHGFCCNENKPVRHIIKKIHEYYFDKPVSLVDSFYVGHTQDGKNQFYFDEVPPYPGNNFFGVYNIGYDTLSAKRLGISCGDMNCEVVPEQLYRYRFINDLNWPMDNNNIQSLFHDTLWHWQGISEFMLVFPIIEIDTTWRDGPHGYVCPEVTDIRATTPDDAGVIMLWNTRNGQQQWQISYGPEGTLPDSGIVTTCYTPAYRLRDLDSCTSYDVYVRAICHHDSTEYSQWTGPVNINVCDTSSQDSTQTESLLRPTALEQYTLLIPNPAHDKVQISSSYNIESLQVFTLDGRKLEQLPVGDRYTSIDIKGWNPGAYIIVIHTPAGLVSRKLVVK